MTSTPSTQQAHKFAGLAWSALILGIVGVVGSPVLLFNNLTAVAAAVGMVLGGIALFGTRKALAASGAALSVLAIVFTVMAQDAAIEEFDRELGTLGSDPAAVRDVTVSGCEVVDDGYGYTSGRATVGITNSTDATQSYLVTVSLNDATGARVGTVNAISNSLAAGQSVTLAGMDASGLVADGVAPGPVACTVADVDRFPS